MNSRLIDASLSECSGSGDPIELAPQEVHVWHISLRGDGANPDPLAALLDEGERKRAAGFRRDLHRHRYVVAHGQLRRLLGAYCGLPAAALRFEVGRHGKPHLAVGQGGGGMGFNLSHSGDLALVAVASTPWVGVDVECWRDVGNLEAVVRKCFADSEASAWRALPAELQRPAFFARWTEKEAFVKACGRGIALGLKECVVSGGDSPRLIGVPPGCGAVDEWRLFALTAGAQASAAVAVRLGDCRLRRFSLAPDTLARVVPRLRS